MLKQHLRRKSGIKYNEDTKTTQETVSELCVGTVTTYGNYLQPLQTNIPKIKLTQLKKYSS